MAPLGARYLLWSTPRMPRAGRLLLGLSQKRGTVQYLQMLCHCELLHRLRLNSCMLTNGPSQCEPAEVGGISLMPSNSIFSHSHVNVSLLQSSSDIRQAFLVRLPRDIIRVNRVSLHILLQSFRDRSRRLVQVRLGACAGIRHRRRRVMLKTGSRLRRHSRSKSSNLSGR